MEVAHERLKRLFEIVQLMLQLAQVGFEILNVGHDDEEYFSWDKAIFRTGSESLAGAV